MHTRYAAPESAAETSVDTVLAADELEVASAIESVVAAVLADVVEATTMAAVVGAELFVATATEGWLLLDVATSPPDEEPLGPTVTVVE